jgi:signal transduction histidine kinase
MRKEFVAGVSHELKTPISLIDGYAEALKDNIVDAEDRNYFIEVIIDESRKMNNLVIDMLDLAQLESGTFKFEKEYFKLDELIFTTLKKYKSIFEERGIKFKENLIKEIQVYSDWERIEQVVTNFITNAIRHTKANGTITVEMSIRENKVFVSVENTGSNIPEDEITKIWGKFYKIDKSRNRKLGGTGVGLSIVKNILTKHGSEYGVENTDSGVKFYFSLDIC